MTAPGVRCARQGFAHALSGSVLHHDQGHQRTEPVNRGEKQDGRFKPRQSGNPNGRPRGARNRTTQAVEALFDGEAETITRKAIELAKGGDTVALRLCMERLCLPRRDRPVSFMLPAIENVAGVVKASGALLEAVAAGELTPAEAAELGKLVEAHVKAIEATESVG